MQWGRLADAVVARRVELGYERREDLAAASGIGARTLGDIERGEEKGYRRSLLARLERALSWPPGAAQAILDGSAPPEPGSRVAYAEVATGRGAPPTELHPLAAELNAMLADDSPLSDLTQQIVIEWVHRVLAGARLQMQGKEAPDLIVEYLDQETARATVDPSARRRPGPPTNIALLASLLADDSHISGQARRALHQMVAAALRLGEEAMLAWDAKHGPTDAELLERADGVEQMPVPPTRPRARR